MKTSALLCSLALLISYGCQAMEQIPAQFFVKEGDQLHTVKRHDVSPFLRNLSPQQLTKFSAMGNRIKAVKLSNGDFRLEERGELLGGGPGWACIVAMAGYTAVGIAALGTLIVTAPSGPGCVAAAAAVAAGGTAAVTKAVIVVAATPTP